MFGMDGAMLELLDELAQSVREGRVVSTGELSDPEYLYVALAANDMGMLRRRGYTVPQALGQLGEGNVAKLVARWRHRP